MKKWLDRQMQPQKLAGMAPAAGKGAATLGHVEREHRTKWLIGQADLV